MVEIDMSGVNKKKLVIGVLGIIAVALVIVYLGTRSSPPEPPAAQPAAAEPLALKKEPPAISSDEIRRQQRIAVLMKQWEKIKAGEVGGVEPKWYQEFKGVDSGFCDAVARFEGVSRFITYEMAGEDPSVIGASQEELDNVLRQRTLPFAKAMLGALEAGKIPRCGIYEGEGGEPNISNRQFLEKVAEALRKAKIDLQEVGTTSAKLRQLFLKAVKQEMAGPDGLIERWKKGSSGAEGLIYSFLREYDFTPAEIGLTPTDAEKILGSRGQGG